MMIIRIAVVLNECSRPAAGAPIFWPFLVDWNCDNYPFICFSIGKRKRSLIGWLKSVLWVLRLFRLLSAKWLWWLLTNRKMRFKLWWAFEVKVYYDWSPGYAADGWIKWFLLKNQEDIIPEVYPLVITNRFPIILIAWKCYVHLTLYFIQLMKFSVGWWLDSLRGLSGSNWLWLFTILFSNSLGTKNKGIKKILVEF